MTTTDVGLGFAAFGVTVAECFIHTRCTLATVGGRRHAAARWETLFELVLAIDIWLYMEAKWLVIPILIGAYLGKLWSFPKPDAAGPSTPTQATPCP